MPSLRLKATAPLCQDFKHPIYVIWNGAHREGGDTSTVHACVPPPCHSHLRAEDDRESDLLPVSAPLHLPVDDWRLPRLGVSVPRTHLGSTSQTRSGLK